MKISPTISFGKTLVATCQLNTSDKDSSECKIFELSNNEDKDYFEKLEDNSNWNGNRFVWVMKRLMDSGSIGKSNDTFAMENSNGECLGFINVISRRQPENKKFIQYIETCPAYSHKKENRTTKNIGHSLVAFVVKQAKQEERDEVSVLAFDKGSRKFFGRNCKFKLGTESCYDYILSNKKFTSFLNRFESKTGNKITFIE